MKILNKFGSEPDNVSPCAFCKKAQEPIEDLEVCPICNFDDDGETCVPELCKHYTEDIDPDSVQEYSSDTELSEAEKYKRRYERERDEYAKLLNAYVALAARVADYTCADCADSGRCEPQCRHKVERDIISTYWCRYGVIKKEDK